MKAFLSHSSRDKELVRAVAKELGRQFCVFDEQVFATGEEFKASIELGLDESSVFVLFASRDALMSIWVEFETEEAWLRKLRKILSKSLVYIIDSSVEIDEFPEWLRRALIRRENAAKVIARDIRYHLDELLRERQHPHFVGRSHDVDELEKVLTPLDGRAPPHAVFISGLPGIGRRSLVKRTSPNILNLNKYVEVRLQEGDRINDICVRVADYIEPYSTKEGFQRIVDDIRKLSNQEALKRLLTNLRAIVSAGEVPILFDEDGLLNDEGYINEPIREILQELTPDDEAYIFFITIRRPKWTLEETIPSAHLGPLKKEGMKRLLSLLAKHAELTVTSGELAELSEYVAGYPPAAYYAIQQAKNYGIELLISDKSRLVEFRTSVFLKHFSKLNLSVEEQNLLRLMANYSPLPLSVIAEVLSVDLRTLHEMVVRLIDLALIITTQNGYYRIADPVSVAALRAFGFPEDEEHKKLSKSLHELLSDSELDRPRLELSSVLFRAARWAKDDEVAKGAIYLSNDLIKLTETHYHARKYQAAEEFGYSALQERPESVTARSYLIRALIQNEKWQEVENQISELKNYALLRDVHFLTGFLKRKQGDTKAAISEYSESMKLGRRGIAVIRELALCYHLEGDHEKALTHIEEALPKYSDNRFIVDLWVLITTQLRDETAARKALSRLEVIDRPIFYYHRLSRVELAFGRQDEALAAARRACECEASPPFEVLSQLAYCELEIGNIQKAEELLTNLDKRFGNIRHDIRIGLRCRLEIARGHYGKALQLCEQMRDTDNYFYKNIKRDALSGELFASALEDSVRVKYEKELSSLEEDLADISSEQIIPAELDVPPLKA